MPRASAVVSPHDGQLVRGCFSVRHLHLTAHAPLCILFKDITHLLKPSAPNRCSHHRPTTYTLSGNAPSSVAMAASHPSPPASQPLLVPSPPCMHHATCVRCPPPQDHTVQTLNSNTVSPCHPAALPGRTSCPATPPPPSPWWRRRWVCRLATRAEASPPPTSSRPSRRSRREGVWWRWSETA